MTDHSELGGIFDMTGVTRGPDGIKRYEGLPRNLVQMFRAAVDRAPHGLDDCHGDPLSDGCAEPFKGPWSCQRPL